MTTRTCSTPAASSPTTPLRRRRPTSLGLVLLGALLVAACSSGDDTSTEPPVIESSDTGSSDVDTAGPDGTGPDSTVDAASPDDVDTGPAPLGFSTERFDVPVPANEIPEPPARIAENQPTVPVDESIAVASMLDGTGVFDGADELIDAGIEAGVWTEIEAVRAIISVLLGERPPESIVGFDDVVHPSLGGLLDRAVVLLDDPSVDAEQRDDLARLTAFFLAPDGADGPEGLRRPHGFAGAPRVQTGCGIGSSVSEDGLFQAEYTGRRYCSEERDGDTIYYPVAMRDEGAVWEQAAERFFEIIEQARTGYLDLVATEMPPVKFLISPRPDPTGIAAAHVVSRTGESTCRGAIFATDSFMAQDVELDNTMAHELFHCVQGEWEGTFPSAGEDFVEEAGASYFAYKLLGQCAPGDASRGPALDQHTANRSLLEASYDAWFFWAYLDEHGKLGASQIGQLHRAFKAGTPIDEALRSFVPDIDRTMNEFYVRMMGPGLACGFQGWQTTGQRDITDVGPVEFADAPWQGTRYEVTYPAKRYFAQVAGDALPIGMAEPGRSPSEAAWVDVEPVIRTECDDEESWYVVLATAGPAASAAPDRALEVTERQDPQCDPCPIGSWAFDVADMSAFFESFAPPGQDVDITIGGTWTLQFGAPTGSSTVVSDSQNTVITFSNSLGGFESTVTGGGQGQWTGNGSNLSVSNYTSTGTASLFGVSSTSTSTDSAGAAYTCEGDVMTITLQEQQIGLTRIDPVRGNPYFG